MPSDCGREVAFFECNCWLRQELSSICESLLLMVSKVVSKVVNRITKECSNWCYFVNVIVFFSSPSPKHQQRQHGRDRRVHRGRQRTPSDTRTLCQQVLNIYFSNSASFTSTSSSYNATGLWILWRFHNGTKHPLTYTPHTVTSCN